MRKLVLYGGNGFDSCKKFGKYEVIGENDNTKTFTNYNKAIEYYNSLKGERTFWDITGVPELIESWIYED